jgi:C1A family cysteine protease
MDSVRGCVAGHIRAQTMAPSKVSRMPQASLDVWDWQRDLPDHRDYALRSNLVRRALRRLRSIAKSDRDPPHVDWREYCPPVEDQQGLPTSAAHACLGMAQYFERRASGRLLRPSRSFLDYTARRLQRGVALGGATLRVTLKALVQFGMPPEVHWPYTAANLTSEPSPFVYGFGRETRAIRYVRLDPADGTGDDALANIRRFLAAGFVCTLGFPVPDSIGDGPEIPYPTLADSVSVGHAVTVVGYDDTLRIRSDKGALLVRDSLGRGWGEDGYGWLPYAYVRQRLAVDAWTLLKRGWLRSGEFFSPESAD